MTTSREQFESAWDEMTGSREGRCKQLRAGIGYRNTPAQEAWQVWQASRAAIVVEPPEGITTRQALDAGYMGDYAAGMDDGIEQTVKAIRAAGIIVKGDS